MIVTGRLNPDRPTASFYRILVKSDLNQDAAALQQAASTREMETNVDRIWIYKFPGILVIHPRLQIDFRIREFGLE
jgi:hypothetical protein